MPETVKKNRLKLILSLLFSAIIIIFIYRKIQLDELISVFSDLRLPYFLMYISFLLLQLLIATGRWKMIMEQIGNIHVPFIKNLSLVVGSYSANLVIPAKMGEIVRVIWLKPYHPAINTLGLVLVEKFWDILSLIVIFAVSILLLNAREPGYELPAYIAGTTMIIMFICYILRYRLIKLMDRFPGFLKKKLKMDETGAGLTKLLDRQHAVLGKLILYSLCLWVIQVSQFYFMFACFDVFIPLPELFAGSSLAVLAGALVISIGGIGPRDAVILWFFGAHAPPGILISVGILSVLRIIVPALAGLPFFYLQTRNAL